MSEIEHNTAEENKDLNAQGENPSELGQLTEKPLVDDALQPPLEEPAPENEAEEASLSFIKLVKRLIDKSNAILDILDSTEPNLTKDDLRFLGEDFKNQLLKNQESAARTIESLTASVKSLTDTLEKTEN